MLSFMTCVVLFADVISDNYFGTLQTLCNKAGVDFTAQATGNRLRILWLIICKQKGRVQNRKRRILGKAYTWQL